MSFFFLAQVASTYLYFLLTPFDIRKFCLRHPEIRDVCDIGQYLFWDSKAAWWATAVMFLLNNIFIQVRDERIRVWCSPRN